MLEIQGLCFAMSNLQLLMVKGAAGPPVVLNPEASPPRRPKGVSLNKSDCQVGFPLEQEPDVLWWTSERLPGSCTKLEELFETVEAVNRQV